MQNYQNLVPNVFVCQKNQILGVFFGFVCEKTWRAGQIDLKLGMQKLWILFWKIQKTLILFRQPFIVNLTVLKSGSTFFTWIQESDFCAHFIKPHSTQSECALKTLKNTCVDNWFAFFALWMSFIIKSRMGSKSCMRFKSSKGTLYSEWVCYRLPDETGSKFWFQNTCRKVENDFQKRNKTKITKVLFLETPCSFPLNYISGWVLLHEVSVMARMTLWAILMNKGKS